MFARGGTGRIVVVECRGPAGQLALITERTNKGSLRAPRQKSKTGRTT